MVKTENNGKNLVFVYGTLRQGFHNHRFLQWTGHEATFIGDAVTVNRFNMIACGFPILLRPLGDGVNVEDQMPALQVVGEVYEVDDETLANLDRLEGVARGMYTRDEEPVILKAATTLARAIHEPTPTMTVAIYVGGGDYWRRHRHEVVAPTDDRLDWAVWYNQREKELASEEEEVEEETISNAEALRIVFGMARAAAGSPDDRQQEALRIVEEMIANEFDDEDEEDIRAAASGSE